MNPVAKRISSGVAVFLTGLLAVCGSAWPAATATGAASLNAPMNDTGSNGSRAGSRPNIDDGAAVGAFIDGVLRAQMDRYKFPGAVVAIVKDGAVLYAAGYGHANIEKDLPVDPATSLFRIASTTKLFTWTAVMQLVEQGKLDLDTDINTYLKNVKIPSTFPQPITLRHLMTHTAGFEEGGVGYELSMDPQHLPSILETVIKHMPARIRAPGVMSAYSNYGATLAGLIVQQVSGESYEDYIQHHIFDPLGMHYATTREPVPGALAPYRVIGYAREEGEFVTQPLTFEGGYRPAGSASVAALDMARFMIAHLQNGRYQSQAILKPETARLMHATAFVLDPRLPGMCLGFYEQRMAGLRIIAHGGNDPLFNTDMYLAPDKQVGIFVSYSGNSGESGEALARAFFERYFPVPKTVLPPPPVDFAQTIMKYAGTYQFTRRSETKIDKFYSLPAQLSLSASGTHLFIGQGDELESFAPIGVNLFQEVGGPHQIAFRTDAAGNVTHLFLDFLPFMPLERTALLDNPYLWYACVGITSLLFLAVLIGSYCRRSRIKALPLPARRAALLVNVTAAWSLATYIVGFFVLLAVDMVTKLSRIPLSLKLFLVMPCIEIGLTIFLLGAAIAMWRQGVGRIATRIYYSCAALAALLVTLFLYHWNLVGWRFG